MLAQEQGKQIVPVLIDTARDLLERRMTGRRNCPVCNEIYNLYFKPPKFDNVCDNHPDAQLVHRADDNSETVRARLATYEEQTRPLVELLSTSPTCCAPLTAAGDAEDIYHELEAIVKS